jgi:hypothetical protein
VAGLVPATARVDHSARLSKLAGAKPTAIMCGGTVAVSRKWRPLNMPAPYLRGIWLDSSLVPDAAAAYPFCLPVFTKDFELHFDHAITILVGENGTGKSTLLEGIAALAGYDDAGGGKG